jgi:hypothetical protein
LICIPVIRLYCSNVKIGTIAAIICLLLFPSVSNAFCFEEAATSYGLNPQLLKTIAQTESNFNPQAINKNRNGSTDIGLMQINSFWLPVLGLDPNRLISDPCYNTKAGARILQQCIDKHGHTWNAIGCYNAASKSKSVAYSWKIFDRLVTQPDKGKYHEKSPQKQKPQQSFLSFSVVDTLQDGPGQ